MSNTKNTITQVRSVVGFCESENLTNVNPDFFIGKYDALNRIRKATYPADRDGPGKEMYPEYNKGGALLSLKMDGADYVKEVAYNARGQRILIAYGNKIMTRYAYDPNTFRVLRQRSALFIQSGHTYTPNKGIRQDLQYTYDLEGTITSINDAAPKNTSAQGPGDLLRVFTHDPLRRLLSATGRETTNVYNQPSWYLNTRTQDYTKTNLYERRYAYDKIGNIQELKHIADGKPNQDFIRDYTYESASNKLKSFTVNSTTYINQYDASGSLTKEGESRYYEWGANDKLAVFKNQAGTSTPSVYTNYFYNAQGERIKKHTRKGNKIIVTFYMDGGMFETSYTKTVGGSIDNNRFYNTIKISDDGALIATIRVGNNVDDNTFAIKYIVGDHLNNSTAVLKTTGSLINREEYYPFGETSFGGFQYKRYRYNGKEKDEESGLYEYGQRYYAPWLCRFVSVDPIAEDYPHLSSYNYASNRPITARDLEGLQADDEVRESNNSNPSKHDNKSSQPSDNKIDNLKDQPNTLPEVNIEATASWHEGVNWTDELPTGARFGELDLGGLKILGTDYGIYGSDFKYLKEGLSNGDFSEEEFFAAAMSHALEENTDSYTINQFRSEQVLVRRAEREAFGSLMSMFAPPNPEDYDNPLEYAVFMAVFMIESIDPIPEGGGSSQKSNRQLVKEKQLPIQGMIRFIPRKTDLNIGRIKEVKKGKNKGYMDRFGNRWFQGPTRTKGEAFEWDVELSEAGLSQLKDWVKKEKSHINVSLKGRITH